MECTLVLMRMKSFVHIYMQIVSLELRHINRGAQELEDIRHIYSFHGNKLNQREGHLQTLPLSARTRMTKQQKQT